MRGATLAFNPGLIILFIIVSIIKMIFKTISDVNKEMEEQYAREKAAEKAVADAKAAAERDRIEWATINGKRVRMYTFEEQFEVSRVKFDKQTIKMDHGLSYTCDTYGVWRDRFGNTVPESIHNLLETRVRRVFGISPKWFEI